MAPGRPATTRPTATRLQPGTASSSRAPSRTAIESARSRSTSSVHAQTPPINGSRTTMRRQTVRFAAIAALLAIPAGPAAATAAADAVHPAAPPSSPWGYVVVRVANASSTPLPKDRGNSLGGVNSGGRTQVGHYEVSLPRLANGTSAVAVSPLGTVARRCVVSNWFNIGSTELIDVACFTVGGAAVDSPFVLTF